MGGCGAGAPSLGMVSAIGSGTVVGSMGLAGDAADNVMACAPGAMPAVPPLLPAAPGVLSLNLQPISSAAPGVAQHVFHPV